MTANFIIRTFRQRANIAPAINLDVNFNGDIQNYGQPLGDAAYREMVADTEAVIPAGAQLVIIETLTKTAKSFTATSKGAWVIADIPYGGFEFLPENLEDEDEGTLLGEAPVKIRAIGDNPAPLSDEEVAESERAADRGPAEADLGEQMAEAATSELPEAPSEAPTQDSPAS